MFAGWKGKFIRAQCLLLVVSVAMLFAACSGSGNADGGISEDGDGGGGDAGSDVFTIERVARTGEYPTIAVDSAGQPHVCYFDYDDKYVKYAVRQGSDWVITPIQYVALDGGTVADGGDCSISLDVSGVPHVCYYDSGSGQFKYAFKPGSTWEIEDVPLSPDPNSTSGGTYGPSYGQCSIAVDRSTGVAHLAMGMWGTMGAALGYWRPGMSQAMVVDDSIGNTGRHNSIALDPQGNPGIAYESLQEPSLKYAAWNGSGFDVEVVGPMEGIYWEKRLTSIFIDQNSHPHIAFYNGGFVYAYHDATAWVTVDIPYNCGYPSLSLADDGAGGAQLAFVATDVGSLTMLKHGHWNGSDWLFETVEEDADDVDACSIAVDDGGGIHIAYSQGTLDTDIKYAHR